MIVLNEKTTNTTNKALDRAFELLDAFATEGVSMNVSEIARFLNVTRVTAQTLVNSLEKANYIEKDPSNGRYVFGYKMFVYGNKYVYQYPFLHVVEKYVTQFSSEHEIKINVSVLKPHGKLLIILTKDLSLIPNMTAGSLVSAHVSAGGKLLLSLLPEKELTKTLNEMDFLPMTSHTITDKKKLRENFEIILKRGYSSEFEELALRRGCIAAPVFDISGNPIAAISASADIDRIKREEEQLAQDVKFLASQISVELGYQYKTGSPML